MYWFVVHDINSYHKHPDIIAFNDVNKYTSQIKDGDYIVYYCKGLMILLGIFKIVKKTESFIKDDMKKYSVIKKIEPFIKPKKEINFKNIVFSENLDMFERHRKFLKMNNWGSAIQGTNRLRPLTKHDFDIIKKIMIN